MSTDKEILLSTIPEESQRVQAEVGEFYDKNGLVDCVLYVVDHVWDESTKLKAENALVSKDENSIYYKLLFDIFNVCEHFKICDSHILFIKKSYDRLKKFVPNVSEELIAKHDLSKYNFVQSVGYTAKWVHGKECPAWQAGLKNHYENEPHHPQYSPGERMARQYLEESLIDMVACHWERNLKGDENVSDSELVDFDSKFLLRYIEDDRKAVEELIMTIKTSK